MTTQVRHQVAASIGVVVLAFVVSLLPRTAWGVTPPAPTPLSPAAASVVDQPLFSWSAVAGADSYQVQVALDEDFLTMTDPLDGTEFQSVAVHGTVYIPTFSYTAKTHYWRVRAVDNNIVGDWSTATAFTRRWTNNDEAPGVATAQPASRVENVRLVDGTAANRIAITWDPVPGASGYEVQISEDDAFQNTALAPRCITPHTTLTPVLSGKYVRREEPESRCLTPVAGSTYYARVRAVDVIAESDYPAPEEQKPPINGLWSDQRREPSESDPTPLTFTATNPEGTGSVGTAATPLAGSGIHPDIPLLSWEPVPAASSYLVVIALDRDFTDRVATFATTAAHLMPEVTFDDVNSGQSYHWFALPCTQPDPTVDCDTAERTAINHANKVGTFGKRSVATTGLAANLGDAGTNVTLSWRDALSVAHTADAGYTPGGVTTYDVEVTSGEWKAAGQYITDNLALSTSRQPLSPGTYRWRVRARDGADQPLKWAYGPDFTIAGAATTPGPGPGPVDPSPPADPGQTPGPPAQSTPPTVYDSPPADEPSAAKVPPTKPGKPRIQATAARRLSVKWAAAQALGVPVGHYVVYRSKDGKRYSKVRTTKTTTSSLKALPGKVYWFVVVADSSAGESKPSRTTRFRMPS